MALVLEPDPDAVSEPDPEAEPEPEPEAEPKLVLVLVSTDEVDTWELLLVGAELEKVGMLDEEVRTLDEVSAGIETLLLGTELLVVSCTSGACSVPTAPRVLVLVITPLAL